MKKEFIYVDLNEMNKNRIAILNPRTLRAIRDSYGEMVSGMNLLLWTDDLDKDDKYDPLVYSGKLIFNPKDEKWFIEVNESEIEHLSKSDKFKHFSLREVIGYDEYLEIQRTHPEWL